MNQEQLNKIEIELKKEFEEYYAKNTQFNNEYKKLLARKLNFHIEDLLYKSFIDNNYVQLNVDYKPIINVSRYTFTFNDYKIYQVDSLELPQYLSQSDNVYKNEIIYITNTFERLIWQLDVTEDIKDYIDNDKILYENESSRCFISLV